MLDLAEEWRALDRVRRRPDTAAHWDRRAMTYTLADTPNDYVREFIRNMALTRPSRIFDMGCGPGSLAVPLARAGHQVIAADFSEGMLARLRDNAAGSGAPLLDTDAVLARSGGAFCGCSTERRAVPGVAAMKLSWDDDWRVAGLDAESVDFAIASRSIITHDLEDSLAKLSSVARERVCVTVATGFSPRVDVRMARDIGLATQRHNDAVYVFGIASDLGFEPEVSYIHSRRARIFASREEAFEKLMETVEIVDSAHEQLALDEARRRVGAWADAHLVPCSGGDGRWTLDEPRVVPWAFISWDVRDVR